MSEIDYTSKVLIWGQPGKEAAESVVAGNPVWQFQPQALLEPLFFSVPEGFHVFPAFGPAEDRTEGDDDDIEEDDDVEEEMLLGAVDAWVFENGEMLDEWWRWHGLAPGGRR